MQTGEPPVTPRASDQQQQRLEFRLTPGQPTAHRSPSVPLARVRANLGWEPRAVARVRPPLGAAHPAAAAFGYFTSPKLSASKRDFEAMLCRAGARLTPRKPQLKPYPVRLLLAGEEKPGGSCCAWYVIKNTGNLTIKPARFLALIPDQRGFGKEHPRFECLSQPDPMSF